MCDALSFTLSIVVGVAVVVLLAVSLLSLIGTFNLVKDTLFFWKKKDK